MDMPMYMRTFRDPASSFSAKFCVARARRIMFPALSGQNLSTRSQKTRPQSLENVRTAKNRQVNVIHGRHHVHLVYMTVGAWCLPMSIVTCSRKCIDPIRPSVLVKVSCRLCRIVPFLFCSVQRLKCSVPGHDLLQAAWTGCSHSVAPTWSSLFHIDCIARAQQTCFYDKHYSRSCGAVPNMLDLRRRSSFPILFRCGMIQLATAQN